MAGAAEAGGLVQALGGGRAVGDRQLGAVQAGVARAARSPPRSARGRRRRRGPRGRPRCPRCGRSPACRRRRSARPSPSHAPSRSAIRTSRSLPELGRAAPRRARAWRRTRRARRPARAAAARAAAAPRRGGPDRISTRESNVTRPARRGVDNPDGLSRSEPRAPGGRRRARAPRRGEADARHRQPVRDDDVRPAQAPRRVRAAGALRRDRGRDRSARATRSSSCRRRRARRYDVVVAFGGDGTVNEAANGLAGTDTPLTCLPGGSNNVFAQDARDPQRPRRRDRAPALAARPLGAAARRPRPRQRPRVHVRRRHGAGRQRRRARSTRTRD